MGCSVSRFTISSSMHSHPTLYLFHHASSSSSPAAPHSHDDVPSSPATGRPRALSVPTPLVHHPPSGKGDSDHLVFLTSTSYGSALHAPPTSEQQHHPGEPVPSPDSVINAWELMDGLDGYEMGKSLPTKNQGLGVEEDEFLQTSAEKPSSKLGKSKPLWKHFSEESFLLKLDPIVVSSYRRALCARKPPKKLLPDSNEFEFELPPDSCCSRPPPPPVSGGGILVYFTSLRGIRKTYEDCCTVLNIFRALRVAVDERDVSMHSAYGKELRGLLAERSLPQVFIGGKHVGGAEEIRRMNDSGELSELVKGFPTQGECLSCGDARFVMCLKCNGSRKVFDEEEDRLRRCPDCNENGLIRCRNCSVC